MGGDGDAGPDCQRQPLPEICLRGVAGVALGVVGREGLQLEVGLTGVIFRTEHDFDCPQKVPLGRGQTHDLAVEQVGHVLVVHLQIDRAVAAHKRRLLFV